MLNIMILNSIYSDVYRLRKYRSVEEMEYILFLLQYDHLNEKKYPLFNAKTFIEKNGIRIEYISDLLRVSKRMSIYYRGYGFHKQRMIEKFYKKYRSYSSEDIDKLVYTIICNQKLNEKYFVFGEYNDKYRKKARLTVRSIDHLFLSYIRSLLGLMFVLSFLVLVVTIYFIYVDRSFNLSEEKFNFAIEIVFFGIVCFIGRIYLTKKWMKPTDYELEHMDYRCGV